MFGVSFNFRKVCRRFVEDRRVRFDHRKACRRLIDFRTVRLITANRVGGLYMLGESV